jgi:hypothetical protein
MEHVPQSQARPHKGATSEKIRQAAPEGPRNRIRSSIAAQGIKNHGACPDAVQQGLRNAGEEHAAGAQTTPAVKAAPEDLKGSGSQLALTESVIFNEKQELV